MPQTVAWNLCCVLYKCKFFSLRNCVNRYYTIQMPAQTHTHTHTHTRACMHACMHARTHARTHMYTHNMGAIQVLRNAFFREIGPPPPRNANNVEPYTFVTLFPEKLTLPHPLLHYVTLEWPHRSNYNKMHRELSFWENYVISKIGFEVWQMQ